MSEKKYTVFISSTYECLKEERAIVIETILELSHIPVGMEAFTASSDDKWNLIKKAIDDSDYIILIIGHRYGTITDDGIGWVEKEYDYAISRKIPVLVFIKDENSPSTPNQRETSTKHINLLKAFKKKVNPKNIPFWKDRNDLARKVSTSLSNIFKTTPRVGWVRADSFQERLKNAKSVSTSTMQELSDLLSKFKSLRELPLRRTDPSWDKEYTATQIADNISSCKNARYDALLFFNAAFDTSSPFYLDFKESVDCKSTRKFINGATKVLERIKNYFEQQGSNKPPQ
ncbi:MAG: DUF4062 domain-containing protein [Betaproteobacteria bacterium]|nr:DUF4062 domain-containing protein [Betaproteobacteria bacterium]